MPHAHQELTENGRLLDARTQRPADLGQADDDGQQEQKVQEMTRHDD